MNEVRIAVDIQGITKRRNKKQDRTDRFGMGRSLHLVPALVDRMQEYCVCIYGTLRIYVQYMLLVENGTDLGVTGNTNSDLTVVL